MIEKAQHHVRLVSSYVAKSLEKSVVLNVVSIFGEQYVSMFRFSCNNYLDEASIFFIFYGLQADHVHLI